MSDLEEKTKTYQDSLELMSDDELLKECKSMIWLSSYASNNEKSEYHWKCDSCYEECYRREKVFIYDRAYKTC
jgi:sulfur transfer protein SufE